MANEARCEDVICDLTSRPSGKLQQAGKAGQASLQAVREAL
jgi:hypothetical protein